MAAEDSIHFHSKALVLRNILVNLPNTRTRRELSTQIQKLGRMAEAFDKQFPWHLVLAMPAKKLRKKKGPYLHRLSQQSKHVDRLLWESLKEMVTQDFPDANRLGKGKLNRVCQKMVESFNGSIYRGTEQQILLAMKRARGELKS